jgi:hypothetical protein
MPITPFLDGNASKFDFETKRVMGVAFEMACVQLSDRGDLANEVLAKRIIALVEAGERSPELLCEGGLKDFSELWACLWQS